MQYEVNTPEEYMNGLEDDWRKRKVQELRELIQAKGPDLEEGINYKMLCYQDEKGVIFHLNAQKGYVSLYIGNASKVDTDGSLLEGIDRGKGCLRFKQSTALQNTRMDEFIERTIDMWKRGEDIYC